MILLVTVFNVAVFGGGLVWLTGRLGSEREDSADVAEELVLERLRNRLDVQGRLRAGEILGWPRWERFEDAVLVQLQGTETRGGLLLDMREVARSGRPRIVPSGVALPLRHPPPAGPRKVVLPPVRWRERWTVPDRGFAPRLLLQLAAVAHGASLALGRPLPTGVVRAAAGRLEFHNPFPYPLRVAAPTVLRHMRYTLVLPRPRPREVWGACYITGRLPALPWEVLPALSSARYIGLSRQRQRAYDRVMGHQERHMLTAARDGAVPVVLYQASVILPIPDRQGRPWGSGVFPSPLWPTLVPGPLFAPWRWLRGATIDVLPEREGRPLLDVAGIFLNPLGSAHRPPAWDGDRVLADIRRAASDGSTIENERGLAVPLYLSSGELWGGVWLQPRRERVVATLLRELSPWFLLSTALLTAATFVGMHRLVLDPVGRLARGARRLASGELSTRIPEVHRRDELADLVRSFNTMAVQVEGFNARLAREVQEATAAALEAEAAAMTQRRLAATGELAAGIAHEINNPLGGMLNALEVLRRGDLDAAKRHEYLELLEGGLEHIRGTVGKVLRLAPRETRTELVDLADPLGDALGLVRHRAVEQGTVIRLTGAGGPRSVDAPRALEPWRGLPPVRGQQNELGQAVLNLLVNALDALEGWRPESGPEPGGGTVTVGLEAAGQELHLWIVDDGPGVDPEVLPRAADLFFTTKQSGKGTGLGLAIVHSVVAGHGGTVRLSSPAQGGFRVDLHLPIAAEPGP